MKKILAILLIFGSFSTYATTYMCLALGGAKAKDAAYAFNSDENRFYQGSKEEVLGSDSTVEMIELSDVEVAVARCPHCYTIKGKLMGVVLINLDISVDLGHFSLATEDGNISEELKCSVTDKKIITLE